MYEEAIGFLRHFSPRCFMQVAGAAPDLTFPMTAAPRRAAHYGRSLALQSNVQKLQVEGSEYI